MQVIEVNGVAAWQGLQRVTRLQHRAARIVDDLLDRKLALRTVATRAQACMTPARRMPSSPRLASCAPAGSTWRCASRAT